MGRKPCCSEEELNRGAWTAEEDRILKDYITSNGSEGRWRSLPKKAGLKRCGKSCRLRWLNYLRPDIKRGNITLEEEDLIIRLHKLLGNRWSLIAGRLPGRTDNEIKNYWNTYLRKKIQNQHQTEEAVRLPAMGLHQNADLHAGVSSGEAIKELPMKADEWWDGLSEGWLDAGHAAATAAAPAQEELTSVDYLYMSMEKGYDGSGHVGEGLLGMEVLGASDWQLGGDDEKLFGWWSLADEISQVWEW